MAEVSATTRSDQRAAAHRKFGQAVTYRQRSDTINRQTGTVTASNTDTAISNVLTSEMDPKSIANTGGMFVVGTRVFRIQNGDMPETPPSLTSQIVFGGDTYQITMFVKSSDGNAWDLYCPKV